MKRKETHPKVSVIITAYNEDKKIERCLDSIMRQSYGDFEIVLITGGISPIC